jgi:predicted RNA-binding protein YlxR (DUF448 family)
MMTKPHPLRTCLGCGQKGLKGDLVRIVMVDGVLTVDAQGRLPGRGAYVCPREGCIELLLKKKGRLSYSLRASLSPDAEERFLRGLLHAGVGEE